VYLRLARLKKGGTTDGLEQPARNNKKEDESRREKKWRAGPAVPTLPSLWFHVRFSGGSNLVAKYYVLSKETWGGTEGTVVLQRSL